MPHRTCTGTLHTSPPLTSAPHVKTPARAYARRAIRRYQPDDGIAGDAGARLNVLRRAPLCRSRQNNYKPARRSSAHNLCIFQHAAMFSFLARLPLASCHYLYSSLLPQDDTLFSLQIMYVCRQDRAMDGGGTACGAMTATWQNNIQHCAFTRWRHFACARCGASRFCLPTIAPSPPSRLATMVYFAPHARSAPLSFLHLCTPSFLTYAFSRMASTRSEPISA